MSATIPKRAVEVLRAIGAGAEVVSADWKCGRRYYFAAGGNIRRENIWRLSRAGFVSTSDRKILITAAGRSWLAGKDW